MCDLVCVIPLYGDDCQDVSLRMVSSLALQKTGYIVKYVFYYDDTVSRATINQICFLMSQRGRILDKDYYIFYSEITSSGHKRNLGLKFALENSIYVWFLDQDDYLLRDDAIQIILYNCYKAQLDAVQIKFNIPDSVDAANRKTIFNTPTMPWKYIFKTSKLEGYAFREDCEYGSDIPITIRYLSDNDHIKFNDDLTFNFYIDNQIPTIKATIYFYNYLNTNSHMYSFAIKDKEHQKEPMDKAYTLIREIKESKVNENN